MPNTTCLPSRCGVGTVVMKNWLPLVLGPGGQRVKREVRTQVALRKRGGSGTSIGHGQQERHVVLVLKVLVSKLLAVDALAWQGGGTSRATGSSAAQHAPPVPLWLVKSPPCNMKLGITRWKPLQDKRIQELRGATTQQNLARTSPCSRSPSLRCTGRGSSRRSWGHQRRAQR